MQTHLEPYCELITLVGPFVFHSDSVPAPLVLDDERLGCGFMSTRTKDIVFVSKLRQFASNSGINLIGRGLEAKGLDVHIL